MERHNKLILCAFFSKKIIKLALNKPKTLRRRWSGRNWSRNKRELQVVSAMRCVCKVSKKKKVSRGPWPHIFIIDRSCLPNVVNRRMNIMLRFWMIASLKVLFSSLLHRAVWTLRRSPPRTLVPSSPLPSTLRKGSASPKRWRLPRSSASATLILKTRQQTYLLSFIIFSRPRTPRR